MPRPAPEIHAILEWLRRHGSRRNVAGMARYGIRSARVFGVSMTAMRPLARRLGHDHRLALALWKTGWLEARILASFVDDPAQVTPAQMDRWAADFDNWALCDSVCTHLFRRTPHAWAKVRQWSGSRDEFVKRAGFALIAGLTVQDKRAPDRAFLDLLPIIETGATDDRNVVKKAVSWALRQIGKRNRALSRAAIVVAKQLTHSESPAARWVGRDALRELSRRKMKTVKGREG